MPPVARVVALVLAGLLAGLLAGSPVAPVSAAPADPRPPLPRLAPPAAGLVAGDPVQVGDLTLRPCSIVRRALCGSIRRPWEPGNPAAGRTKVWFAFVPARQGPTTETVVPHEGGPGYSTTGSGSSYAAMYGPLLDDRNLLLVDQRGTGRSDPIDCPALQNLVIDYRVAAGRCGRQLGDRSDDYTTARSADDLAAVIERLGLAPVSLYGDSYGTFFVQVFAGRHPELVKDVVVDGAYPTYGETGWYPTQGPAMRRAHTVACQRSAPCRSAGRDFLPTLRSVLRIVREKPWTGVAPDAEGTPMRVRVDAPSLAAVAYGSTYAPVFYRELTASLRAALRGDRVPLLRLVAEATGGGTDAGAVRWYSEGLDAAVACQDYPQLYDMTAPPGRVREAQLARAIVRRGDARPRTYGPFTVGEYAASDWQALDWCTRWPVSPVDNPAGPPVPPAGYPDVPVLVLSGELDSITTAAEGDLVADQFPDATHYVIRNSTHVTALGDRDSCAVRILRQFLRAPGSETAVARCAREVEPIRTLGMMPETVADVGPARAAGPVPLRLRRAGVAAALTVQDAIGRWWNNYSGQGVGLRGGTWRYRGNDVVTIRLRGYRFVSDLAVSGTVVWDRERERIRVRLTLAGPGVDGRLRGAWHTRRVGADARLRGRLDGRPVGLTFRAP